MEYVHWNSPMKNRMFTPICSRNWIQQKMVKWKFYKKCVCKDKLGTGIVLWLFSVPITHPISLAKTNWFMPSKWLALELLLLKATSHESKIAEQNGMHVTLLSCEGNFVWAFGHARQRANSSLLVRTLMTHIIVFLLFNTSIV